MGYLAMTPWEVYGSHQKVGIKQNPVKIYPNRGILWTFRNLEAHVVMEANLLVKIHRSSALILKPLIVDHRKTTKAIVNMSNSPHNAADNNVNAENPVILVDSESSHRYHGAFHDAFS
ncbi:hypothetical protein PIB30_021990 [Stylosanthes scabra]|uniref:Uncharacterized protein n=1 Tax=Stylosanthes scabra TaxID=79078 RepID=A0ABU6W932_9FABA|nr:hypothetical protein [Stylosanthes scabra]